MSFEEQMRFGEQMSFGQQINFEMSFGQQISFGQQMNFGEQMTSEERKEWETLCRMYHVDSLYEAIQGCREELEFLVRCAERLEPRVYHAGCAVYPRWFRKRDFFLTKYNFINNIKNKVWKIGDLSKQIPIIWFQTTGGY